MLELARCCFLCGPAYFALLLALRMAPPAAADAPGVLLRFNGQDLQGFYTYVDQKRQQDPAHVFSVTPEGWLRISGAQQGYLSTDQEFTDYRLEVEFKWGSDDPQSDSGIFFHAEPSDRLWAQSLEVQMRAGATCDLCLIGAGTQLEANGTLYTQGCIDRPGKGDPAREVERPRGEWNRLALECRDGNVTVTLNGQRVLQGRQAHPRKGRVYFQSYRGELFYRKIEFRSLSR